MSSAGPEAAHTQTVALFRRAAWEVAQKDLKDLSLEHQVSELGLDSVAMLEVIGFLEEELDVNFPDDALARVQTIRDLSSLVHQLQS